MCIITKATFATTAALALCCADVGGHLVAAEWAEADLIAILQSETASAAERAITCKRLAICGSEKAIPELAKLLSDKQLSSWARIALEAIPGTAAKAALRSALPSVDGRLLIGVINSIGVKQDAEAVGDLKQYLGRSHPQIASAAAVALGHVGSSEALLALEQALIDSPPNVRSAVAEGCILGAEQLLEAGKFEQAADLFDKVRQADVPGQRAREATRGAILARRSQGIPLLIEQLRSADEQMFGMALHTTRDIPGPAVTEALTAQLSSFTEQRQSLLVRVLAERDDEAAVPAIRRLAERGPLHVRIVAIEVLGVVGDADCFATLMDAAMDENAALAAAAKASLANLPVAEIDGRLVARLQNATGKARQMLIETVGARRIGAAVDILIEAASDSDRGISGAALTALGQTIGLDQLSVLVDHLVSAKHTDSLETARQALLAASVRMPDPDACAVQLSAAMEQASESTRLVLLRILASVGGGQALAVVGAAAEGTHEAEKDVASQLLGKWMTADAAPVLLELALPKANDKYRIRALRGYLRIARQFKLPNEQRVQMCQQALAVADRDTEREMVLQILKRYPSQAGLAVAVNASQIKSIKELANETSLSIAQKLMERSGNQVQAERWLQLVGQQPVKVEIIKADYGANGTTKDVTEIVRRHASDLPWVTLPSPNYNTSFGGDPAPGTVKTLTVEYRINGTHGKASFAENSMILLPTPSGA